MLVGLDSCGLTSGVEEKLEGVKGEIGGGWAYHLGTRAGKADR